MITYEIPEMIDLVAQKIIKNAEISIKTSVFSGKKDPLQAFCEKIVDETILNYPEIIDLFNRSVGKNEGLFEEYKSILITNLKIVFLTKTILINGIENCLFDWMAEQLLQEDVNNFLDLPKIKDIFVDIMGEYIKRVGTYSYL